LEPPVVTRALARCKQSALYARPPVSLGADRRPGAGAEEGAAGAARRGGADAPGRAQDGLALDPQVAEALAALAEAQGAAREKRAALRADVERLERQLRAVLQT
jgi:hypothetical protein